MTFGLIGFKLNLDRCFHNFTSDKYAIVEGNFSDFHLGWNDSAKSSPVSGDDVEVLARKISFSDEVTHTDSRSHERDPKA